MQETIKGQVTSGLSQPNKPLQMQVTVLKHFQPNNRKKTGAFPEVKKFNMNDYPPTSRYLHLHPVFRLVDSLMCNQGTCKPNGIVRQYPNNCLNNGNKNLCTDSVSNGNKYITKKCSIPGHQFSAKCLSPNSCRARKQDRIKTNMNNINSKNNLRLSLRDRKYCSLAQNQIAVIKEEQEVPVTDYVKQLKCEIKSCSASKVATFKGSDVDYLQQIKNELIVSKAKSSIEKRNTIDDLRNEINEYRRSKSSEVQNIDVKSRDYSMEKKVSHGSVEKDSPQITDASDHEGPVVTLWRSKESLASSSDMDAVSGRTSKLNFEEKLEEANTLIEKVRKTLKDIGSGVYQKSPRLGNMATVVEEPVKDCNCNCSAKKVEEMYPLIRAEELEKQKEEKLRKKVEEEVLIQKEEELRKKVEEELQIQKEEEFQKKMEEALQRQKEVLQKQMEEELERQKQEILRRKEAEELEKQKEEKCRRLKEELELEKQNEIRLQTEEKQLEKQKKEFQLELQDALNKQKELLQKQMEAMMGESEEDKRQPQQEGCSTEIMQHSVKAFDVSLLKEEGTNKENNKKQDLGSANDIQTRNEKEEDEEKEVEEGEQWNVSDDKETMWIESDDKDILINENQNEYSSLLSPTESMKELQSKLETISEKSIEYDSAQSVPKAESKDLGKESLNKRSIASVDKVETKELTSETKKSEKNILEKSSKSATEVTHKQSLERKSRPSIDGSDIKKSGSRLSKDMSETKNLEKRSSTKRSTLDEIKEVENTNELKEGRRESKSTEKIGSEKSSSAAKRNNLSIDGAETKELKNINESATGRRESKLTERITSVKSSRSSTDRVECKEERIGSVKSSKSSTDRVECKGACHTPSRLSAEQPDVQNGSGSQKSVSETSNIEKVLSKTHKCSIQKLPPINICGRFVIQKTLNLTIQPTGSATNVIEEDGKNVGYQEIKVDLDEISEGPVRKKCPEECKDEEGLCRDIEDIIDVGCQLDEVLAEEGSNGITSPAFVKALSQETIKLLLKSYQILEDHKHVGETQKLATQMHGLIQSLPRSSEGTSTFASTESSVRPSEDGARTQSSQKSEGLTRPGKPTNKTLGSEPARTPWEIGFYETKSTQISSTTLLNRDEYGFREGYMTEWTVPKPSVMSGRSVPASLSAATAPPLNAAGAELQEEPVKDVNPLMRSIDDGTAKKQMVQVLSELKMKSDETPSVSQPLQSPRPPVIIPEFVPLLPSEADAPDLTPCALRSGHNSCMLGQGVIENHVKKSASSSSSSSGSSSESHYTPDKFPMNKDTLKEDEETKKKKGTKSVSSTSSSSSSNIGTYSSTDSITSEYNAHSMPSKKSIKSGGSVSKEVKQTETSTDKNLQTSLLSTSDSSTSTEVEEETDKGNNTISYFIKGLTGTSHEELEKIRSSPSFPKSDLQKWSKTMLAEGRKSEESSRRPSSTQERRVSLNEPDKSPEEEEKLKSSPRLSRESEKEKVVGSTEYSTEELSEGEPSLKDMRQESLDKFKRFQDFSKFAKDALHGRKISRNEPTVLSLVEERKRPLKRPYDRGEGGAVRDLPVFHRHGVIAEAETPLMFDHSHSDPIPFDDSFSEGEISCKCSLSTGEVHMCNKHHDLKKMAQKQLRRHAEDPVKMEPVSANETMRIARQRSQYNNWITYYLQKHNKYCDNRSDTSYSSTDKS